MNGENENEDKNKKIVEKYKKELKSSEVKRVQKFGGKGGKKKANIDVCIKVKGEDGKIDEIIIKGEEKKKKTKKKKEVVDMIKEIVGEIKEPVEGGVLEEMEKLQE